MSNLSYLDTLNGVIDPEFMEPMIGLIDNHKNWGATMARLPSHIIVNLVDEIKRLREKVGGYKTIPADELDSL